MKRRRETDNNNDEREDVEVVNRRQIKFKIDEEKIFDIWNCFIKSPIDILAYMFKNMLSCCEYNILQMVSKNTKSVVKEIIIHLVNTGSKNIQKIQFQTMFLNIGAHAAYNCYYSLLIWYKNNSNLSFLACAQLYSAALRNTDMDILKWLKENKYTLPLTQDKLLWYSAPFGGESKLKWLDSKRPMNDKIRAKISRICAETGNLETLAWCQKMNCEISSSTWIGAAQGDKPHVISWLIYNNIPFNSDTILEAASKGLSHVLEWFMKYDLIKVDINMPEILIINQKKITHTIGQMYVCPSVVDGAKLGFDSVKIGAIYRSALENIQHIGDGTKNVINWTFNVSGISICDTIRKSTKLADAPTILMWAHKNGFIPCSQNKTCHKCHEFMEAVPYFSAEYGFLDALKWYTEIGFTLDENVLCRAALRDHIEILKWAHETKKVFSTMISRCAAWKNNFKILKWLKSKNYTIAPEVFTISIYRNNWVIFDWAVKNKIPSNEICWVSNLFYQDLNLVGFPTPPDFNKNYKIEQIISPTNIWNALEEGDPNLNYAKSIKIAGWLIDRRCPIESFETLKWIDSLNFLPLFQNINAYSSINPKIAISFAENGNLNSLIWLNKKGIHNTSNNDELCYEAAKMGHLHIIQYVVKEFGCELNKTMCYKAAEGDQWLTLEWLIDNKCPYDIKISLNAAHYGQLDLLTRWYNKGTKLGIPKCELLNESVCSIAAFKGYFDILEWARKVGCPWDWKTIRFAKFQLELKRDRPYSECKYYYKICEFASKNGCENKLWEEMTEEEKNIHDYPENEVNNNLQ